MIRIPLRSRFSRFDLGGDFEALPDVSDEALETMGVAPMPLKNRGIRVKGARIRLTSDGQFIFGETGIAVWAVPALDPDGDIRDIVALRPDAPYEFWTHLRRAEVLADLDHPLIASSFLGAEIKVHRNPAEWLRDHGRGFVPLDFRMLALHRERLLDHVLVTNDPGLRAELDRALNPKKRPVRIIYEAV